MNRRIGFFIGFVILAATVAAAWLFLMKAVFPIEPRLYSVVGLMSL